LVEGEQPDDFGLDLDFLDVDVVVPLDDAFGLLHVGLLVHELELEEGGLADERLGPLGILNPGELD